MDAISKYFGLAPNYEPKNSPKKVAAKKASKRAASMTRKRLPVKAAAAVAAAAKSKKITRKISVSISNVKKALKTIKEVTELPVFLIRAHACLCPFGGRKCFGASVSPSFRLPKDSFVISFAQAGEASCPSEQALIRNYPSIIKYLYLHSQGDLQSIANTNKPRFSLFSGIRRAVGPVEYPNINFTLNEWAEKEDGTRSLVAREENPWGVYQLKKAYTHPTNDIFLSNNISVLSQDEKREDWTLEEIIKEVYAKKKIKSAIFISTGCLSTCEKAKERDKADTKRVRADVATHGRLMDNANAEYVTQRETLTFAELKSLGLNAITNVGINRPEAYPDPSEYLEMLEEGLTEKEALGDLPMLVHEDDRPVLSKHGVTFKGVRNV